MTRPTNRLRQSQEFPPLPVDADHWQEVVQAMLLSPRQAQMVEMLLRGMHLKQIATAMGIGEPTVRTYLERICVRTGTQGRMQLVTYIWGVSHQIVCATCPQKR